MRANAVSCLIVCFSVLSGCGADSEWNNQTEGISGSLARLVYDKNSENEGETAGALYTLAKGHLVRIAVNDAAEFEVTDEIPINESAETLTTDNHAVYVGSPEFVRSYMYTPASGLTFVSESPERPAESDPVVTDGEFAYSTVTEFGWSFNQQEFEAIGGSLYIYAIDDNKVLTEINRIPNIGIPMGLALWGKVLMTCDSKNGLQQWDVSDAMDVKQLKVISDVTCRDILHLGDGHFATVGEAGIYQIKPTEEQTFTLISIHR